VTPIKRPIREPEVARIAVLALFGRMVTTFDGQRAPDAATG
jgi:hypothetical protein